jgi:hypothetical protein
VLDATPLLRLYARYRLSQLARMKMDDAQERQLMGLVRRAAQTRFGRDHGFARVKSIADYQAAVPLRRYEDLRTEYWQPDFPVLENITWPGRIPYFAKSSGTSTGATKFIPVSRAMIGSNQRAAFDLLTHHIAYRRHSRVLGGKNFMLGGSTELTALAPGVMAGDLSGIAAREVPRWARSRYFPPPDLALIADWEEKAARLAARSLDEDIRTFGGTPSWLLVFVNHLRKLRPGAPGRLVDYYPNLELLVHGGVNFAPYRRRFDALLDGSRAELREVYPASEGFIAIADRGPGEGLRLVIDNGLFFEFVPTNELDGAKPTRHWIADVEMDVDYALVVATNAGLWSYIVGDTVRFVSRDPPRILVTGRTSYGLSAFGEHLIGEQIEEAVAAAAASIGASVDDFSVGPIYPEEPGRPGHHLFVVEFSAAISSEALDVFARELDRKLSAASEDYATHRAGDFGMGPPEIRVVRPGTFAAWMKSRGKAGGQNKVPRVIHDSGLFDTLRKASGDSSA